MFDMGFAKPSGFFGKIMVPMMNLSHAKLAAWGFSQVGDVPADAHVLDVGCGGGANIAQWLNRCSKGQVWGLDYAPLCVEASMKLNRDAIAAGRCQVIQGSVSDIPLQSDTMDVVSAFETVYFWPDIVQDFTEVCRVLKPGGTFIFVNEISGEHPQAKKLESMVEGMRLFPTPIYMQHLKDAGFNQVNAIHHPNGRWVCVIATK